MIKASRQLHRRRRTVMSTVAMFVVVWANMALQPCLMAAAPMLPAEHEHGDCPHCPEGSHHVSDDGPRCSFIEDFDFDGRSPSLPDLPVALPAPAPDWLFTSLDSDRVLPAPPSGALVRDGPPLYLRHCVFLN